MMKIVFLDIDGVLYTQKALTLDREHSSKSKNFDINCLSFLSEIVNATESKIVISSSRRVHKENNWFLWQQIIENLSKVWIEEKIVIDTTPVLQNTTRWVEIKQRLDSHNDFKIESFVILDDEWNMWELDKFFVRCSPILWITENEKDLAIKLLIRKEL